jgi:hypothetical protein
MSVAQLLSKAASMGVTLRLDGETVKVDGPKAARDAIRPELVAHKPEIVAHLRAATNDAVPSDCVGALRHPDGGLYLPWGPKLSADDVQAMRAELIAMIEELSALERWPDQFRDDVLTRAIRGPLSDLLPNRAYFAKRVERARVVPAARELAAARVWRANEDLTNRGYR